MDEKANELTKRDYLKAAELIATCKENRLPCVIDILNKIGIDVGDVKKMFSENPQTKRQETLSKSREQADRSKWRYTNDETVLDIRRLYDQGVSLTALGRYCETDKATMYKYLWATKRITDYTRPKVEEGIKKWRELTEIE